MKKDFLVDEIDAILPQTQCRRCGFSGCRPYAMAIAEGRANINQCPPGGDEGIGKLAKLLRISPIPPLNTAHGIPKPRSVALIDEEFCIGCTLCIHACPVDAIAGAAKHAHTVIAVECTGCELCIAPCPLDCISMVPPEALRAPIMSEGDKQDVSVESGSGREDERKSAGRARARYQFRLQRLEREKQQREERLTQKAGATAPVPSTAADRKKAAIQAALKRAVVSPGQTSKKNDSTVR